MCRHILLTLYQLVIVLGLHVVLVNGQVYETRTEIVCSPGNVKLECATGEVINIISAYYGRTNAVTCPGKDVTNQHCYTPGARHVIRQICHNKPECIVYAKNEVFGDPCAGTTKYLEVHYICVKSDIKSTIICDYNPLTLTCPSGQLIKIVNANFGRYNSVTCPHTHVSNIYCTAAGTKDVISNQCNNKEECTVQYASMFGDPCYGTYKYMDVQYRCVTKESLPVLLPTSPPPCGCVRNVSLLWDGMNWVHAEK